MHSSPTEIRQDNFGPISWTEQVRGLRNVKHDQVKCHDVRDSFDQKRSVISYSPMAGNMANLFSKALIVEHFARRRAAINVEYIDDAS